VFWVQDSVWVAGWLWHNLQAERLHAGTALIALT